MATQRMTVVYVDSNGNTSAKILTTSGGAASTLAAILAKSNADQQLTWEGPLAVNGTPVPTASVYQEVGDQAQLLFQTGIGTQVTVVIPAPQASIFLADGMTVDITQIAAIIAAVISNVTDQAGNAVTTYLGGVRTSR